VGVFEVSSTIAIRFDEIESKRRGDKIRAFFKIGPGPERPLQASPSVSLFLISYKQF